MVSMQDPVNANSLFRCLNDPKQSSSVKIELASQAWRTELSYALPMKAFYLAEWTLESLLKANMSPDDKLKYLALLASILSSTSTHVLTKKDVQVLLKTPILPILTSFFRPSTAHLEPHLHKDPQALHQLCIIASKLLLPALARTTNVVPVHELLVSFISWTLSLSSQIHTANESTPSRSTTAENSERDAPNVDARQQPNKSKLDVDMLADALMSPVVQWFHSLVPVQRKKLHSLFLSPPSTSTSSTTNDLDVNSPINCPPINTFAQVYHILPASVLTLINEILFDQDALKRLISTPLPSSLLRSPPIYLPCFFNDFCRALETNKDTLFPLVKSSRTLSGNLKAEQEASSAKAYRREAFGVFKQLLETLSTPVTDVLLVPQLLRTAKERRLYIKGENEIQWKQVLQGLLDLNSDNNEQTDILAALTDFNFDVKLSRQSRDPKLFEALLEKHKRTQSLDTFVRELVEEMSWIEEGEGEIRSFELRRKLELVKRELEEREVHALFDELDQVLFPRGGREGEEGERLPKRRRLEVQDPNMKGKKVELCFTLLECPQLPNIKGLEKFISSLDEKLHEILNSNFVDEDEETLANWNTIKTLCLQWSNLQSQRIWDTLKIMLDKSSRVTSQRLLLSIARFVVTTLQMCGNPPIDIRTKIASYLDSVISKFSDFLLRQDANQILERFCHPLSVLVSDADTLALSLWSWITTEGRLEVFSMYCSSSALDNLARVILLPPSNLNLEERGDRLSSFREGQRRVLGSAEFYELQQLRSSILSQLVRIFPETKTPLTRKDIRVTLPYYFIVQRIPQEYLSKKVRQALINKTVAVDLNLTEDALKWRVFLRKLLFHWNAQNIPISELVSFVELKGQDPSPSLLSVTLDLFKLNAIDIISMLKASHGHSRLQALLDGLHWGNVDSTTSCPVQAVSIFVEQMVDLLPVDRLPSETKDYLVQYLRTTKDVFADREGFPLWSLDSSTPIWNSGYKEAVDLCRAFWKLAFWLQNDVFDEYFHHFAQTSALVTVKYVRDATSYDKMQAFNSAFTLFEFSIQVRRRTLNGKLSTSPILIFLGAYIELCKAVRNNYQAEIRECLAAAGKGMSSPEYEAVLGFLQVTLREAIIEKDNSTVESAIRILSTLLFIQAPGLRKITPISMLVMSQLDSYINAAYRNDQYKQGMLQLILSTVEFLERFCRESTSTLNRNQVSGIISLLNTILQPSSFNLKNLSKASTSKLFGTSAVSLAIGRDIFQGTCRCLQILIRHQKEELITLFPHFISLSTSLLSVLRTPALSLKAGSKTHHSCRITFPFWVWPDDHAVTPCPTVEDAKSYSRLISSLTTKHHVYVSKLRTSKPPPSNLSAPLSKHGLFLLLSYLHFCVGDGRFTISMDFRKELEVGWIEMLSCMGKHERESLIKGYLTDREEGERMILRSIFKKWDKERYQGS